MNEAVSWWRIDCLYDLSYFVDVDFVGKLRPENDPRRGELAPDSTRSFYSGEFRHLDVENTNIRSLSQCQLHRLFAIARFEFGKVRPKPFLQDLSQVVALGHVVFSD